MNKGFPGRVDAEKGKEGSVCPFPAYRQWKYEDSELYLGAVFTFSGENGWSNVAELYCRLR